MTINKSQGQSIKVVGLDLETECFAYGKLYVGSSRARKENKLYRGKVTEYGQCPNTDTLGIS